MIYKSKNEERNQQIVQFIGDCVTKKVMSRRSAVAEAARVFSLSEPQIYYIIRRQIKLSNYKKENMEVRQNG